MVLAGHGVRAASPTRLHPRALASPEAFADQVDALTTVLEEVAPQVVVTYAADGGYGHPDHVRAHEIAVAAVRRVPAGRRLYATVIGRETLDAGLAAGRRAAGLPFRMPAPDELPTVPDGRSPCGSTWPDRRAARLAALRAHATQVALWEASAPVGVRDEQRGRAAAAGRRGVHAAGRGARRPRRRRPVRGGGVMPGLLALLVVDGLLLGAIGLVLTPMYAGPVPTPVGALLSIARAAVAGAARRRARPATGPWPARR